MLWANSTNRFLLRILLRAGCSLLQWIKIPSMLDNKSILVIFGWWAAVIHRQFKKQAYYNKHRNTCWISLFCREIKSTVKTFRLLPSPGYCKQYCNEHQGTCVKVSYILTEVIAIIFTQGKFSLRKFFSMSRAQVCIHFWLLKQGEKHSYVGLTAATSQLWPWKYEYSPKYSKTDLAGTHIGLFWGIF